MPEWSSPFGLPGENRTHNRNLGGHYKCKCLVKWYKKQAISFNNLRIFLCISYTKICKFCSLKQVLYRFYTNFIPSFQGFPGHLQNKFIPVIHPLIIVYHKDMNKSNRDAIKRYSKVEILLTNKSKLSKQIILLMNTTMRLFFASRCVYRSTVLVYVKVYKILRIIRIVSFKVK